ncbi:MAG: three-Cys-motif partner protein TcmP [Promethearchaeota archaeon]
MTEFEDYWDYPEHSRYKHKILKKYLPTFRKIAKKWWTFIYVDGFAGSGKYNDGSDGSPILAIRELNRLYEEKSIPHYGSILCFFIEADKKNFEELKQNIQDLGKFNKNIKVKYYNGKFEDKYPEILEQFKDIFEKNPALFFLDPFGYNQIPFKIIEDMFTLKKPEIILTFMVDFIRRFHDDPSKFKAYERLFGSPDWKENFEKNYGHISDKNEAFSIFFQDLLKKAGAEYTIRYKIRHEKTNQRLYDIIHATTHFKGLEVMKRIMFDLGIKGTFEFHGKFEDSLKNTKKITDFLDVDPDIENLKKWLIKFVKKDVFYTFDELNEIIYTETPYIEKQLRQCLKEMEKKRLISVKRITSQTKRGLSGKDQIRFV